jgi:putative transposase
MARMRRLVVPGQPLHVIQRGNNRAASFVGTGDFLHYKYFLRAASERAQCAIHAYALMGNHIHLLVTPADEHGPARMMQQLGRRYVRYFNACHARTGTLWEGRYRSTLIDSHHYFFTCSRYIELNPVRAGLVAHPEQYRWSSFHHNAHGARDPLLTPHALYRELGTRPLDQRTNYRALFATVIGADALDAIRRATNRGTVLGTTRFRSAIEEAAQRRVTRLARGGDRRSRAFRVERDRRPGERE